MNITVTYHAVTQLAERHPDAPLRNRAEFIEDEVRAAYRAGRVGVECPGRGYRANTKGHKRAAKRYLAWTEDKARCYVVIRTHSKRCVVTTTLKADRRDVAA